MYEARVQRVPIAEIRRLNREAEQFFFESATIRFFRSRIAREAFATRDGTRAYFVTSEQFVDSAGTKARRFYTVRRAMLLGDGIRPAGQVDTIGKFQQWRTRKGAEAEAQRLAASLVDESTSSMRGGSFFSKRRQDHGSRESSNAMPALQALVEKLGRPIGDHP